MTPARWDRLKTVFEGALDRPAHARRAWLTEQCADDQALLREAEALLATHETAGDFLEEPVRIDPADLDTLAPGSRVGAYRIIEEIGRGGMGVVYLAEDTRLGRRVALKALPAIAGIDPDLRERLRREARTAATVSHPAVATVYALEEVDDQLFIASEYVAGGTLRTRIDRGALDPSHAGVIAFEMARALCAAHDAGVIHRDLKPENVLLASGGTVKVVDFGIALVEGPAATRLTRAGAMLGTPAYMAPEQLLGWHVDSRADLYSFGVIVKEMLTGRHPLAASASHAPAADGRSPAYAQLMRIATRCMHADPRERYAGARDLLHDLAQDRGLTPPSSALWWWQFHQAVTALLYWLMIVPAWRARELIGGAWGRTFFIVTLGAVIVAANLRLHLWFTSRFYPAEQHWARRRVERWIAGADWTAVITLVSGGLLIGEKNSLLATLLVSFGIGAAVAFLMIEPVTTRAAFKNTTLPPG